MDSRQATVRNMRSKCRCSCVLQFTFRRAVSCVLHRPPSQVIHCIVLFFNDSEHTRSPAFQSNKQFRHPNMGGLSKLEGRGRRALDGTRPYPRLEPPATPRALTAPRVTRSVATGRRQAASPRGLPEQATRGVVYLYRATRAQNSVMILPQVHLRKPCYDFYFL